MADQPCLFGNDFTNLLLTQLPVYSDQILRDIRPIDGFLGHINVGQWEAFRGVQQTKDRFRNVQPNVAKAWEEVSETSCTDAPCDPAEHEICWGWDRLTFGQERISYKTQMLCFDQMISATKAVEHIDQIVSKILRPATSRISSFYVRKKALDLAGNKLLADASMSSFTWTWNPVGDSEVFATPSGFPTSKLTPEMIQRQLPKMRGVGYFGEFTTDPFWGGYNELAELVTDDDTAWDMDKVTTNQALASQFRYMQWTAAHDYYKYGMGGQIGNYMVRVDPFTLRFNRRGNQLQLVLPYKNEDATVGIGSEWNDDYDNAPYQISFIWHRFAWKLLVQQMQQVNPLMPFMVRGLNGQWNFAIDDLGADCNGLPIANYRKNKGFFYADFRYGAEPEYTEFMTAILHLREPKVIYVVPPCNADLTAYPEQNYNSACDGCGGPYSWTPDADADGNFVLDAASTACDDEPLANGAISAATLALLVTALNADGALGALGTWSTDGVLLILTGSDCRPVLPWVV